MAPGRAPHPLDALEFSLGHCPGADFVRSIRYLCFQHPFGLKTRALGHGRGALEQASLCGSAVALGSGTGRGEDAGLGRRAQAVTRPCCSVIRQLRARSSSHWEWRSFPV